MLAGQYSTFFPGPDAPPPTADACKAMLGTLCVLISEKGNMSALAGKARETSLAKATGKPGPASKPKNQAEYYQGVSARIDALIGNDIYSSLSPPSRVVMTRKLIPAILRTTINQEDPIIYTEHMC